MLLTEEQAKTKWCPYANVYIPYQATGAGGNRALSYGDGMQANAKDAKCLASACMAWRWEPEEEYEKRYEAYEDAANIGGISSRAPKHMGFCGLAGKP